MEGTGGGYDHGQRGWPRGQLETFTKSWLSLIARPRHCPGPGIHGSWEPTPLATLRALGLAGLTIIGCNALFYWAGVHVDKAFIYIRFVNNL